MQEEHDPPTMPTDTLNEIGVLKRREIEARILAPLIEALSEEFGSQRVLPIVREVVGRIATEQGEALANSINGRSLADFAGALDAWRAGNALEIQPLENNDRRLSFNVTRCRYAELYRSLGIPELGALLSCHRDFSLIDGFNPSIQLARTQTIMEGASHCDFRFTVKELPQP